MEEIARRTPEASLKEIFLRAVAGLPEEDPRGRVVAEALGYLQQGFDAHYAADGATDDDILVGDNAYALSVETIARLDEPRFVAVASRMIRDGAGRIAAGNEVTLGDLDAAPGRPPRHNLGRRRAEVGGADPARRRPRRSAWVILARERVSACHLARSGRGSCGRCSTGSPAATSC
jgi:hypothetical protein